MNFLKAFRLLRTSMPFFKSVFQAYKETVGAGKTDDASFFGKYFNKVMSQNNLGAPPISESVALQILNISKSLEQVEPRLVLERYYVLFKKNDPKVGGTTYLQSKVYAAKQILMARYPDAQEQEKLFYTQVVQPQEQAEEQERKAQEQAKKAAAEQLLQKQKEKEKKQQKKQEKKQ